MSAQTRKSSKASSAVEAARSRVLEQRRVRAEWQQRRDESAELLRQSRVGVGELVLDDPSAGQRLAADAARLQTEVSMAEQALAAVKPRVAAAEQAYLNAEADLLELEASAAERAHAEHVAAVDDLLAKLEAHDGVRYLPRFNYCRTLEQLNVAYTSEDGDDRVPRATLLASQAAHLRRQAEAVRAVAAGNDPRKHLANDDDLPECVWGPDALVPAPAYQAKIEYWAEVVADLEKLLVTLPQEIADIEADGFHIPGVVPSHGDTETALVRRRARLEDLADELSQARATLDRLRGVEPAPEVLSA